MQGTWEERKKEYMREYYQQHKDKMRQYSHEYYHTHKDDNPELDKSKRRARYAELKQDPEYMERNRQRANKWYHDHKDEVSQRRKEKRMAQYHSDEQQEDRDWCRILKRELKRRVKDDLRRNVGRE